MVVLQVVMGVTQPGDAAKARGEVERGLAERRVAVAGGAVVGNASIDPRRGGEGALIGLLILAMHVEQAADVLQELVFGRGQAQLLGVLVERQVALVSGAGECGGDRAETVAILILNVVPAAPGGDRGEGVVAQVPVQLCRQALVGVLHMAAGIGVDIAVVA